jgi:L,D-transpeptidase ErfK/SrfK
MNHPLYCFRPAIWLALPALLAGCSSTLPVADSEPQTLQLQTLPDRVENHQFSLAPQQNMVGNIASVAARDNDTLPDFARHYGVGYNAISAANDSLDPWVLHDTPQITLPLRFILPDAPHKGIVLNLAGMRLFYYPPQPANTVQTYPVGIGREGWDTPLGLSKIAAKKTNPDWIVPASIQREHAQQGDPLPAVVHAGPDNPLGHYAMPLELGSILIHGTNKPYGIGMRVSHGCVQLYPEDIERLYQQVNVGTPVRIVHQPYLSAWDQDTLYLQAYAPLEKWAQHKTQLQKQARAKLAKLAAEHQVTVDWPSVDRILNTADGMPHAVHSNAAHDNAVPLRHPEQLLGQPTLTELKDSDWALRFEPMPQATAQKLAAMLNHLEPQIPARASADNGSYHVIAGPFKSKQDSQANAKRIAHTFEMKTSLIAPQPKLLSQN